jgi:outer membrane lipoprotein-sorting protein
MFKHFLFCFFLILISSVQANDKDKILENLQNTENLNFNFEQNINGKIEIGNCTIQYPKKIFCEYKKNNKILVSNGKSLVIKTIASFYRYPLNQTPLNLILDKNFLIQKIENLKEKKLGKTFVSFEIKEKESEINVFFDNENFDLVGWQTKDIYQNINVTYISSIKKNQKVNKDLFELPAQN